MTNLTEKIANDIKIAMKEGNSAKRDLLKVVKGEIQRAEQTSTGKVIVEDSQVISIIKKMITNALEFKNNSDAEILNEYMPSQMSTEEMTNLAKLYIEINNLDHPSKMGLVMGYFKTNHPGLYDAKELSQITRKLLTNG